MALSAYVGSFNITTAAAGNTVVVTDPGFTPKVILFWWSGRTESTDAAGRATHLRGFGFTTGTTSNRAIASRSEDAAANAVADSSHRQDACVLEQADAAMVGWADLQSFDANGFTLEILDQFVTNLRVCYLALGGDGVANAATGVFNTPAATGSQSVTAVGFQPDCVVLMLSRGGGSNAPATATHSNVTIGIATGPSNEYVCYGASDDADATMDTEMYHISSEVLSFQGSAPGAGPMLGRAEFTQFTADGFDLNWIDADAGRRVHYLAMNLGGKVKAGTVLTQTDTVTSIGSGSLGFTPKAVLFLSGCRPESTADNSTAHDQWSMGAAISTTARVATGLRDEDGPADAIITTAIEHDAVYVNLDGTGVVGLMDVTAMDSDSFTCIMDDADPAQAMVGFVAFGEGAGGGRTTKNTHPWTLGMALGMEHGIGGVVS